MENNSKLISEDWEFWGAIYSFGVLWFRQQ
jgi:hypothetical protein